MITIDVNVTINNNFFAVKMNGIENLFRCIFYYDPVQRIND
jgi:hypothetical protein